MRKLMLALMISVVVAAVPLAERAHAESEVEKSPVKSVLVTENGRPIGSLRSPAPGSRLVVEIEDGDHQLQAIVQLATVPGERYLLLTDLEDALITGLSEAGVVGAALIGGWLLDSNKEQLVHINVSGIRPAEAGEFDLLQALLLTSDQIRTEFRVEARVVRPLVPLPMPLLSAAVGAGTMTVLALAIFIWRRARRDEGTQWNY